ncbi:MAG: MOSC domain-containing protein [Acidobacteriota bacterium]|nr:MOSC domain-containing protein [Acidobacteriota bacterium]MDH3786776.1 MOSC domain-containing protein [Acidobacteriota bacterium]
MDETTQHLSLSELEAALPSIRQSPADEGSLRQIACRPTTGERRSLEEAELDVAQGLVGDNWQSRGSRHTDNGSSHPDMQLTLMNARVIQKIAGSVERWALAGDQLFVEFDLSRANLPPGSCLAIGNSVIEITPSPHTGCRKFVDRFGLDAMKFVSSSIGRELNLRGVNARVVVPGAIRVGDIVRRQ